MSIRSPSAKRRRLQEETEPENCTYRHLDSNDKSVLRTSTIQTNENPQIEVPKKSYQVYNINGRDGNRLRDCVSIENQGSILVSMFNDKNGRNSNNGGSPNTAEALEMTNTWVQPSINQHGNNDNLFVRRTESFSPGTQSLSIGNSLRDGRTTRGLTMSSFNTSYLSLPQSHLETIYQIEQSQHRIHGSTSFHEWSRHYPPSSGNHNETQFV